MRGPCALGGKDVPLRLVEVRLKRAHAHAGCSEALLVAHLLRRLLPLHLDLADLEARPQLDHFQVTLHACILEAGLDQRRAADIFELELSRDIFGGQRER